MTQVKTNPYAYPVPKQYAEHVGIHHSSTMQNDPRHPKGQCLGYAALMYENDCSAPLFGVLDAKSLEDLLVPTMTFGVQFPKTSTIKLTECIPAGKAGELVQMTVEHADHIIAHQTFAPVPFGEQFMVVSVDSSTTITALRGLGSMYTGRIEAGTVLIKTGNVWAEGDTRPLNGVMSAASFSVHTQIVKNGWAMTGTQKAVLVNKLGSDINMSSSYERMLVEHAEDIDQVLIHGQMSAFIRGGMPMHTTAGLRDYIMLAAPQNVINIATSLDYEGMNTILEEFGLVRIKGHSSTDKVIYADRVFRAAFNRLGRAYNQFSFTQDADIFGKRYSAILTDNYTFTVYHHPQLDCLENDVLGSAAGIGLIVDLATLEIHFMKGRRSLYKEFGFTKDGTEIKQTDSTAADIGGGVILSEFLVVCSNPAANGILIGFNMASCTKTCSPLANLAMPA